MSNAEIVFFSWRKCKLRVKKKEKKREREKKSRQQCTTMENICQERFVSVSPENTKEAGRLVGVGGLY